MHDSGFTPEVRGGAARRRSNWPGILNARLVADSGWRAHPSNVRSAAPSNRFLAYEALPYRIDIERREAAPGEMRIEVDLARQDRSGATAAIELRGQVLCTDPGRRLSGAQVTLSGAAGDRQLSTTLDGVASFKFADVAPGNHELTVDVGNGLIRVAELQV